MLSLMTRGDILTASGSGYRLLQRLSIHMWRILVCRFSHRLSRATPRNERPTRAPRMAELVGMGVPGDWNASIECYTVMKITVFQHVPFHLLWKVAKYCRFAWRNFFEMSRKMRGILGCLSR